MYETIIMQPGVRYDAAFPGSLIALAGAGLRVKHGRNRNLPSAYCSSLPAPRFMLPASASPDYKVTSFPP